MKKIVLLVSLLATALMVTACTSCNTSPCAAQPAPCHQDLKCER